MLINFDRFKLVKPSYLYVDFDKTFTKMYCFETSTIQDTLV